MEEKKVLVVEDDNDTRRGLGLRLRSAGYATVFAQDGVSAIQVARTERPDLVLLDLGLPGGDGFKVLERLKKNIHLAEVPVVVLSAWDPRDHKEKVLKAGATAFLQKPAENQILLAAIKDCLSPIESEPTRKIYNL